MHSPERLKGIGAFVAVAEAGSFAAAAERLHLTGSAVGKAIARLESRLGTRLFERTTRRLELTDAGTAFLRVCTRVLSELEEAEHVLAHEGDEPTGRIRIDLPVTFGRLQVMPRMLPFLHRHPGLQAVISFTDRFVDVVDEGIDVGVRIGGPDQWPATLAHAYLGHERKVFCASPSYLAAHGTPHSLDALTPHAAIVYAKPDGTASPWLIRHGDGPLERHAPEARLVLASAEAQVDAVASGFGITQLPTWLIGDHLTDGRLVAILPQHDTEGLPMHVVWPRARQWLPKVSALVDYLGNALEGTIAP
ncbi:LysR family transcriptional regulator [Luteibacter aegosomatis]|uniref:LysR family transcriptional regulator n=1 Tax=Luteibacter aegosomatis TaxID=2911537 RepID=UPI001FFBD4AD|nr:LysR family transcriptional regulator [Luteibacter aegosomatis]UPG85495.1 LysR family transcriptional regulator [Luteibacter aegosomatis]